MSVTRIFLWECDRCQMERRASGYGLPFEWKYFHEAAQLRHACDSCVPEMLKNGWRPDKDKPDRLIPPNTVSVETALTPETGKVPPEPSKGLHGATTGVETASSLRVGSADWIKHHQKRYLDRWG